jgi:chromosome segregation and condensation protein ScpB
LKRPISLELLESAFFAAGRPLSVHRIASEFGGWEPAEIRKLIRKLAKKLEKSNAELKLQEVQRDRWVLHLPLETDFSPEFNELVHVFLLGDYPKNLYQDQEVRKVLTTIAFHQPVSQAKLWKVLSTISANETWLSINRLQKILDSLIQEGLISMNLKRKPIQIKTTKLFADEWGFDSTKKNLKQQLLRRTKKISNNLKANKT